MYTPHAMSQLHRLKWIDEQIRGGRFPTCRKIAERWEISLRQASRDVEYLRYSMGAPVEYSSERGGYLYTEASYVFPSAILTETERDALTYLSYRYAQSGGEQEARLAELFRRMSGGADSPPMDGGPEIRALPLSDLEAAAYKTLTAAAQEKRKTRLEYMDAGQKKTARVFHPYKVYVSAGNAYAAGFCELRRELRVLRLSRISGIRLLDDGFTVAAGYRETDFGENLPVDFREPYQAVVRFDRTEELGPMILFHEKAGPRTFRMTFRRSDEILRILFSCGDDFTIVSPAWLREEARRRFSALAEKNSENT